MRTAPDSFARPNLAVRRSGRRGGNELRLGRRARNRDTNSEHHGDGHQEGQNPHRDKKTDMGMNSKQGRRHGQDGPLRRSRTPMAAARRVHRRRSQSRRSQSRGDHSHGRSAHYDHWHPPPPSGTRRYVFTDGAPRCTSMTGRTSPRRRLLDPTRHLFIRTSMTAGVRGRYP